MALDIRPDALDLSVFRKIVFDNGEWKRGSPALNYQDVRSKFNKACFVAGFIGALQCR